MKYFLFVFLALVACELQFLDPNDRQYVQDHFVTRGLDLDTPFFEFSSLVENNTTTGDSVLLYVDGIEDGCDELSDVLLDANQSYIFLMRGGNCAPHKKSEIGSKMGASAILIFDPMEKPLQFEETRGPTLVYLLHNSYTHQQVVSDFLQWVEDTEPLVRITADKDPNATLSAWIPFQVFIFLFSLVNVASALRRCILFYKEDQAFHPSLRQIIMVVEISVNVVRMIFMIEPYPLGAGIFNWATWCVVSTWSLSWAMCSTLLIVTYWGEILHPNSLMDTIDERYLSLPKFKYQYFTSCVVILLSDGVLIVLRALRIEIYTISIVTSCIFIVFEFALVCFFFFGGFRLLRHRQKNYTNEKRKRYLVLLVLVFCLGIGQISYLVGIIFSLTDMILYRMNTLRVNIFVFLGVNIVSFCSIHLFLSRRT